MLHKQHLHRYAWCLCCLPWWYSSNKSTHYQQVKEVLRQLRKHRLYAKPEKCEFNRDRVEYLGYILSSEGLTMVADKVQVIWDWPELRKVKDVQSFLGFANFYHQFIYNFLDITVLLTCLTQKQVPFVFGEKECSTFDTLKSAFSSALILTHWVPDWPTIIKTDTSDYALAAILSIQLDSGEIYLVAFHSHFFNNTELNYDITSRCHSAIADSECTYKRYYR